MRRKKPLLKTRGKKLINSTDFSYILHFLLKIKLIYLNSRGAFFGFGLDGLLKVILPYIYREINQFFLHNSGPKSRIDRNGRL